MTRLNCFTAAISAVILGALAQAYAADSAAPSQDARITADVEKAIEERADLGPPNRIHVDTRRGVVYLSGMVVSGLRREDATSVAQQVTGVSRVVSTLYVSW